MVGIKFTLFTSSLLLLSQQVLAAQLFPRQGGVDTSKIPNQCTTKCDPITKDMAACANIQCICTDANSAAISSCLGCALSASTTSDAATTKTTIQTSLDQFVDGCKAAGITVKSVPLEVDGSDSTSSPTTTGSGAPSSSSGAASGSSSSGGSSSNSTNSSSGSSGSSNSTSGGSSSPPNGAIGSRVEVMSALTVALGLGAAALLV